MKFLRLFICAASLFSTVLVTAQAADNVTINVTGKVVASPCVISPDDVVKNIDVGDAIPANDAVGAISATQNITITLTNCPSGSSSVTATFSGSQSDVLPEFMYNNTAATNAAGNVGIVLQRSSTSGLGNGKTYKLDIVKGENPVFNMQTYAYSKGNSSPGDISTSIVMALEYN
ncbi:fimbrial protein [Lelliottia sp. JS-SCA-14]|uniref:fimbrial protein n=1 Tax=Lelliottia sp. JS-SCA-14 TaxID=3110110 RepID=UPI002D77AB1C|nr:fimbrial protein [Lelliottia sp. JS-SCA-14]